MKSSSRSFVLILALSQPALALAGSPRVHVDCDHGDSLAAAIDALSNRRGPLAVEFVGTCVERVTIRRDDVLLAGGSDGATVVGSVSVEGASRVTLRGFRVRDTPGDDPFDAAGDGIRFVAAVQGRAEGLRVEGTGRRGLSFEMSSGEIRDCTVLDAGGIGIFSNSSDIDLFGANVSSRGALAGALIADTSHLFLRRGASLTAEANAVGVAIQVNSAMSLSNLSRLTVRGNADVGLLVTGQGSVAFGEATIEARDNGGVGIAVEELGNWAPFVGFVAQVTSAGNRGGGFLVRRGAFVELRENTSIEDNPGVGLRIEGAAAALSGVTVHGNAGGDVDLSFGARASGQGDALATPPTCDGTVLSRGDLACL